MAFCCEAIRTAAVAAKGFSAGVEAADESASSRSDEDRPRPKAGLAAPEAAKAAIFSAFCNALASCNK